MRSLKPIRMRLDLRTIAYLMVLYGMFVSPSNGQLAFSTDIQEVHPELNTKAVTAEFPFINIGTTPVTIKAIKPACGCTVAASDKTTYKPGEKGIIKATYTISGSTGYQEKQIAVSTIESPDAIKILTIKAYIPSLVMFTPKELRWTVGDAVGSKIVNLNLTSNTRVKILGIDCTTDQVIVKLHTLKEDQSYTIEISPLTTDAPLVGMVMIKMLLPAQTVPKLAFYHFTIAQARRMETN